MQFFAPRRRFFRKMLSGKEPILTLLSKKVWKTWIKKKKIYRNENFYKKCIFRPPDGAFSRKIEKFWWFLNDFLTNFEISDENSTFVRQKFRFWLIINQNFDRYLLWNKKGQFSCLIHLICAMFTTRWRFFENFKWKKANFDTSFKKKFERHGFWRKKLQKWEFVHWFTSDFLKI